MSWVQWNCMPQVTDTCKSLWYQFLGYLLPGLYCSVHKSASSVYQYIINHRSFHGSVILLQSKTMYFGYHNKSTLYCFLVYDKSWSLRVMMLVSPFKWWLSLFLLILYLQILLKFCPSFRYPLICFDPKGSEIS